MSKIILRRRWSGLMAAGFAALVPTVFGVGAPASAAPATNVIVLPGATSAEGIAVGDGATFYAGDLFTGDIYRGDLQRGTAGLLTDAPAGRMAAGMKLDRRSGLLYVAGAFTGQAYVYDGATGATVAAYQFGVAGQSVINDVIVTREGAWFTDSVAPKLYFVPISPTGAPGEFSVLTVTGPAAEISGDFNLNGIAATPDGLTLIVAHSANAKLYTVDPATGASTTIDGVSVPNVDGIVLDAGRLWAVQNFDNKITRWRLSPDLGSGVPDGVITSELFQIPTTAALYGNELAVVNAKFDTGLPPTADQYEVVIVER